MKSKLNIRLFIAPVLTADDWQLYTVSPQLREPCAVAAAALNLALAEAVNAGKSRDEVLVAVWDVMKLHSKTGAGDTEPRGVLGDALDELFGKESSR
jgi:hypothetical protein